LGGAAKSRFVVPANRKLASTGLWLGKKSRLCGRILRGRLLDLLGRYGRVAGCVIPRQRPGTAKGFVFLSLEDETGISNVIVNPDLYEKYRVVINREKFLRVEGVLQNQDHTISIKASRVLPISISAAETQSHDFH